MVYLIKTEVKDPAARIFVIAEAKTMYGGKQIAPGDTAYLFASETQGGAGLVARTTVTAVAATPRPRGVARQTPRISVTLRRTASAKARLGRDQLKTFQKWQDGRPQTELNFKFYRQATNKIGGITERAAAFLEGHF